MPGIDNKCFISCSQDVWKSCNDLSSVRSRPRVRLMKMQAMKFLLQADSFWLEASSSIPNKLTLFYYIILKPNLPLTLLLLISTKVSGTSVLTARAVCLRLPYKGCLLSLPSYRAKNREKELPETEFFKQYKASAFNSQRLLVQIVNFLFKAFTQTYIHTCKIKNSFKLYSML